MKTPKIGPLLIQAFMLFSLNAAIAADQLFQGTVICTNRQYSEKAEMILNIKGSKNITLSGASVSEVCNGEIPEISKVRVKNFNGAKKSKRVEFDASCGSTVFDTTFFYKRKDGNWVWDFALLDQRLVNGLLRPIAVPTECSGPQWP